jgi:hypothetical protein
MESVRVFGVELSSETDDSKTANKIHPTTAPRAGNIRIMEAFLRYITITHQERETEIPFKYRDPTDCPV